MNYYFNIGIHVLFESFFSHIAKSCFKWSEVPEEILSEKNEVKYFIAPFQQALHAFALIRDTVSRSMGHLP